MPAIMLDSTLSPDQQQKLDALRMLSGAAFEQTYVADQLAVHEAALGVVQAYAASGEVPFLNTIAVDAVGMVTDHLKLARQLRPVSEPAR